MRCNSLLGVHMHLLANLPWNEAPRALQRPPPCRASVERVPVSGQCQERIKFLLGTKQSPGSTGNAPGVHRQRHQHFKHAELESQTAGPARHNCKTLISILRPHKQVATIEGNDRFKLTYLTSTPPPHWHEKRRRKEVRQEKCSTGTHHYTVIHFAASWWLKTEQAIPRYDRVDLRSEVPQLLTDAARKGFLDPWHPRSSPNGNHKTESRLAGPCVDRWIGRPGFQGFLLRQGQALGPWAFFVESPRRFSFPTSHRRIVASSSMSCEAAPSPRGPRRALSVRCASGAKTCRRIGRCGWPWAAPQRGSAPSWTSPPTRRPSPACASEKRRE